MAGANRQTIAGAAANYKPSVNVPVTSNPYAPLQNMAKGFGNLLTPRYDGWASSDINGNNVDWKAQNDAFVWAKNAGLDPSKYTPGNTKTAADLRSGYATTGNAYLDDYNNQMANAIAQERYYNQFGLQGTNNPAAHQAGLYKDPLHQREVIASQMALGTHFDPTYGGATTGVNNALGAFNAGGRYTPQQVSAQTVGVNGANQNQIRGRQLANLDVLKNASLGKGPSAAQAQLQAGTDANISQQMALAASARGVNSAAAQRNARNQAALIQQRTGQDAAALRAQEMQAAMQLYTGALGDTRGQDLTFSGQQLQASMANQSASLQAALGNQQAGLSANAQNNQYQLGLMGQQYQYAALGQQQQQQQVQDLMKLNALEYGLRQEQGKNWWQKNAGAIAGGGGALAGILGAIF